MMIKIGVLSVLKKLQMKYKVWVNWINSQKWEVEADTEEEALDKASDGDGELLYEDWDCDNVELDWDDDEQ